MDRYDVYEVQKIFKHITIIRNTMSHLERDKTRRVQTYKSPAEERRTISHSSTFFYPNLFPSHTTFFFNRVASFRIQTVFRHILEALNVTRSDLSRIRTRFSMS